MNHIRIRTRQSALCPLSACLLTACFYFPGLANANNQISGGLSKTPTAGVEVATSGCALEFNAFNLLSEGVQTSIALHSSGLALEFHKSPSDAKIWYRVGKQHSMNKGVIVWGNSQYSGANGERPAVAISKEGYVIEVHSNRENSAGSEQYYRVGKIDPNGDESQTITWKSELIHWDGGFHTSIAINDNGLIVGVHETNVYRGTGLYYRVGQLRNPAGNDYTIAWSSGSTGVNYDDGKNPHIALNNHNQVVEVHQVTGEQLLHYRRGTISEGKIAFTASHRYDNRAMEPAVALLDSGLVLEVHSLNGLNSRTGKLDPSNPALINWSTPVNHNDGIGGGESPALATNGKYAFVTHAKSGAFSAGYVIYYSGAQIYCPDM
jgi:hypothetical protein